MKFSYEFSKLFFFFVSKKIFIIVFQISETKKKEEKKRNTKKTPFIHFFLKISSVENFLNNQLRKKIDVLHTQKKDDDNNDNGEKN